VPLAIAAGAGAESRQDNGWVIVGGLTVGTFFTLFVIPMVYALVNGRREQAPESAALAAEPAPVPRAAE
jgi:multidrug efflux pump